MASLAQQLNTLASQIKCCHDAIPVDEQASGITLEQHSPGNGSTYSRLRAPKGKTLANGKRTMSLQPEEATDWAHKIYARNQQAKLAQCLTLLQQAEAIASTVTWDFGKDAQLVNEGEVFTSEQAAPPVPAKEKPIVTYALKDAKGATELTRTVHAILGDEPSYGRWDAPALCGDRPSPSRMGWRRMDKSHFSCSKCSRALRRLI
jgi:hypothetical protein